MFLYIFLSKINQLYCRLRWSPFQIIIKCMALWVSKNCVRSGWMIWIPDTVRYDGFSVIAEYLNSIINGLSESAKSSLVGFIIPFSGDEKCLKVKRETLTGIVLTNDWIDFLLIPITYLQYVREDIRFRRFSCFALCPFVMYQFININSTALKETANKLVANEYMDALIYSNFLELNNLNS